MGEENGTSEQMYTMRLLDGPFVGDRVVDMFGWPMPDRVIITPVEQSPTGVAIADASKVDLSEWPDEATVHQKTAESQLSDDVPGLVRGAVYMEERDGY